MIHYSNQLIALTGRNGSGKDYLAEYLMTHHGYVRISFSDQLKEIADNLFPWSAPNKDVKPEDKSKLINSIHNVNGLTYRELWKSLDFLRTEIDPVIFASRAQREITKMAGSTRIIVTDIRKPSELKICRNLGFNTIRINNMINPTNDVTENLIDEYNVDFIFEHYKDGQERFAKFCEEEFNLTNTFNIGEIA